MANKPRVGKSRISRARYAQKMSKYRKPRGIKQPVQYFKRTAWLPNWLTTTAGADSFVGLNFRLSQVPNVTDFTNLYDQYKICGVKLEVIPQFDNAQVATPATNIVTQNFHVTDYDDSTTPPNMDALMQHQDVKRVPSTRIIKKYIKPCFASQIFNTGITSTYGARRGWIDCATPDTEHYGMKFGFTSNPNAMRYGLRMTFYLAFKQVR